jgi:O-antigen/teichoic acid export membrane protein
MKLRRNVVWNTLGTLLPLLVGIIVVPWTVHGLGTERFGFLSVTWLLIGYFSIFDLGLGRTLTKLAADRLAQEREEEVAPLASTTLILVAGSSTMIALVIAACSGLIARHLLAASSAGFGSEATFAIACVALSLPFVLIATVLTGLLEAYQQFALTNLVRVPTGILMLVAPLAVLPFTHNLGAITAVLAALRVLNAAMLAFLSFRRVPGLARQGLVFHQQLLGPLLSFGGWLTVSNVVGPVMVYFDRFFIAGTLGAAAVAYYTVPYDVLNRMLILPTAIQGVLFPAFAVLRAQSSPRAVEVFARSSMLTMTLMAVPLVATGLLAYQGLALWVGPTFAEQSALCAKILIVGVVANAMARTAFVFVQGAGRAQWTALLHLLELPFYALALWLLLRSWGIVGAACAWSGRIIIDTVALYAMSVRLEPRLRPIALRDICWVVVATGATACLDGVLTGLAVRLALLFAVGLLCGSLLLGNLGYKLWPLSLRRAP